MQSATAKPTSSKSSRGNYAGNWPNLTDSIRGFRRVQSERSQIQTSEFVANTISSLVWGGLNYAMANNSITTITGESRMGKTVSGIQWKEDHNHGRTVMVNAPPIGGIKGIMRAIAHAVGVNKNGSLLAMTEAIYRAFNPKLHFVSGVMP